MWNIPAFVLKCKSRVAASYLAARLPLFQLWEKCLDGLFLNLLALIIMRTLPICISRHWQMTASDCSRWSFLQQQTRVGILFCKFNSPECSLPYGHSGLKQLPVTHFIPCSPFGASNIMPFLLCLLCIHAGVIHMLVAMSLSFSFGSW